MARTVWFTLRALYGLETGRSCRACGEPISSHDAFGSSEGVCKHCRDRADVNA
jgi:formylmethanofuran dehydrogenase subunit E